MSDHLHIVCHDVPFPPEHGGFTDLYYKIIYLNKLGVKILLHCFTKGRSAAPELEELCVSVRYYKRNLKRISFRVPFIVSTRMNEALVKNLLADDFPVLLEGTHCTWPLISGKLDEGRVFVRLHNVEHIYYRQLAQLEKNFLKRFFYSRESGLLFAWESLLAKSGAAFFAVSRRDGQLFQKINSAAKVQFVPVFSGHENVSSLAGFGEYCIYHGNLSVNENEAAAIWLIREIFSGMQVNLMIAGKDPSKRLLDLASKSPNIHVIANPSTSNMRELISKAHIHVLPSFNKTGVKLKILNALFEGRFVLANKNAVEGVAFEHLCTIAENATGFKNEILRLMKEEFSTSHIRERNEVLNGTYNNEMNALHLRSLIFPRYPKPFHSPF